MVHPKPPHAGLKYASGFLTSLILIVAFATMGAGAKQAPVNAQPASPVWPITASANGRYLVDASGKPFFYFATVPWAAPWNLSHADIQFYLDDIQSKGVNAVHALMLPWHFPQVQGWVTNGTHINGTPPFTTADDLSTINPPYFEEIGYFIDQAAQRGILVVLAPLYQGCCGEGWVDVMRRTDPAVLRDYGRFMGQTFGIKPNIVWLFGGDRMPTGNDANLLDEVAAGIKETDTVHLIAYHHEAGGSVRQINRPWQTLDSIYTYGPGRTGPWHVYVKALEAYDASPAHPSVLHESSFEGEEDGVPKNIRRQAYWAVTSGASGHAYGTNFWGFANGSLWKGMLNWSGMQQIKLLKPFMELYPWQRLVPDQAHTLVTGGYGTFQTGNSTNDSDGADYVTAARADDGSFAMAYVPPTGVGVRTLTVDLGRLAGPQATLFWFNPVNATTTTIGTFTATGKRDVTTPGENGDGWNDWLLVMQSSSATSTATPLPPATDATVIVIVRDSANAPLAGWTIQAIDHADGTVVQTATTSAAGQAQLSRLPPGAYRFCQTMPAGWTNIYPGNACYWITIAPASSLELNFQNQPPMPAPTATVGAVVTIRVSDEASQAPLSGWTIQLVNSTGSTVQTVTDTSGVAFFSNVPAGSYRICEIPAAGYTNVWPGNTCYWMTLNDSSSLDLAFTNQFNVSSTATPPAQGVIRVRVHNAADNAPLVGWVIQMVDDTSEVVVQSGATQSSGEVVFSGVAAGNYRICETLRAGYVNVFPGATCYWMTLGPVADLSLRFINQ